MVSTTRKCCEANWLDHRRSTGKGSFAKVVEMPARQKQLTCTLELGRKEVKARKRCESGKVGMARVERTSQLWTAHSWEHTVLI